MGNTIETEKIDLERESFGESFDRVFGQVKGAFSAVQEKFPKSLTEKQRKAVLASFLTSCLVAFPQNASGEEDSFLDQDTEDHFVPGHSSRRVHFDTLEIKESDVVESVVYHIMGKVPIMRVAMEGMKIPRAMQYREDVEKALGDADSILRSGERGELEHEGDDIRSKFVLNPIKDEEILQNLRELYPNGIPMENGFGDSSVRKAIETAGKVIDIIPLDSFLGGELRERNEHLNSCIDKGYIRSQDGQWFSIVKVEDIPPRISYRGGNFEPE